VSANKTLTLGTGRDSVTLTGWDNTNALVITDFVTGAAGDRLDITAVLNNNLIGWDGDANPFGDAGFLRLVQDGANTLLQVDRDGAAGGAQSFVTLVTFQNTIAANFVRGNILPPYPIGGGALGDTLVGGPNDDPLTGGDDADTLIGNGGDDVLSGGGGEDILVGGDGNDTLTGGPGGDVIDGGPGTDTATYVPVTGDGVSVDMDNPSGGTGDAQGDSFVDVEIITSTDSDDVLRGDANANTLDGRGGNDTLEGRGGNDTLIGGDGTDIVEIDGNWRDFTITLNPDGSYTLLDRRDGSPLGTDTVSGVESLVFNDVTLTPAEALDDTPTSIAISAATIGEFAADDSVVGVLSAIDPDAADVLTFSLTDDAGGRFVVVGNEVRVADGLLLDFEQQPTHTIRVRVTDAAGASFETDLVINLTDVAPEFVIGDARDNTFVAGDGNDRLNGGEGADTLTGGAGNDIYDLDRLEDVVIEAADGGTDMVTGTGTFTLDLANYANVENANQYGTGDAALYGSAGANALYGNAGANILDGRSGADMMMGRNGDDTYYVDDAGDLVREISAGGGVDTVVSSISYILGSNVENLTLAGASTLTGRGNALDNVVTGNAGANYLHGRAGDDLIDGGAGNDQLFGGEGDDTLIGGDGFDFARYDDAAHGDVVASLANDLDNAGAAAGDSYESIEGLVGGAGHDQLTGDSGANTLIGRAGDDHLVGGGGIDRLHGGAGADTFGFYTAPLGRADMDFIVDFAVGEDVLAFSAEAFGLSGSGALANDLLWIGAAATDEAQRFVYDDATGLLYFDADGSGSGMQVTIARLHAGLALSADDFLVTGYAA
jgi:Ca2+-binding RTX toxin-like protein